MNVRSLKIKDVAILFLGNDREKEMNEEMKSLTVKEPLDPQQLTSLDKGML